MKKRFLIVVLFTLFLGSFAVAQTQEETSTLAQLQAENEKLEKKLTKTIKLKKEAKEFLETKYKDAWFSSDENISKKQRKFAKIILRGAKRQERKLKRELKTLHKQIEKRRAKNHNKKIPEFVWCKFRVLLFKNL